MVCWKGAENLTVFYSFFSTAYVEVKKIKDQNDHINDGINVIQL